MSKRHRILLFVAASLAAVMVLLGSFRWQIATETVRPGLESALHRDTGYRITALGEAAITVFPWPVLQITGLELGKPRSQETASVPLLKARLNVYSWLMGDPRITALTLFEPRVNLASLDNEPEAAATLIWAFLRSDPRPSLTMLRVQGAQVLVHGQPLLRNLSVNITNVAANDLRLRAAGQYRGQSVALSAIASSAAKSLSRPFQWQLTASDLSASFEGVLMSPQSLDASGRLRLTLGAAALRSRPLSVPLELAVLLDGTTIEGEGRLAFPLLQLGDATVSRRGLRLDGALDLTLSLAAPRLAATLHAGQLDIGPLLALGADSFENGQWHFPSLRTGPLRAGTADVRLSAGQINVGAHSLGQAAFSAKLTEGRFELALIEARLGGGQIKGRLSGSLTDEGIEARTTLQVEQVDTGPTTGSARSPRASGIATGHGTLESSGNSWDEMVRRASGRGNLTIRDGEIAGIDVERLLRLPEGHVPEGKSRFHALNLKWRMSEGEIAASDDSRITASLWSGEIAGNVNVPSRQMNILARLRLTAAGAAPPRTIKLEGPLFVPATSAVGHPVDRRSNGPEHQKKTANDG